MKPVALLFSLVGAATACLSADVEAPAENEYKNVTHGCLHDRFANLREGYELSVEKMRAMGDATKNAGIDMEEVMQEIREKAKDAFDTIVDCLGENHAYSIANIVALGQVANSEEAKNPEAIKDLCVKFVEKIAQILKSQSYDFEYGKIYEAIDKWVNSLETAKQA